MKNDSQNRPSVLGAQMKFKNSSLNTSKNAKGVVLPPNIGSFSNQINHSSQSNLINSNGNQKVEANFSSFKDFTYNEEFFDSLNRNSVLPIINQTGASRLIYEISQNHNASVSTTTGQFKVRKLLFTFAFLS